MKKILNINGRTVEYELIRRKRKTAELKLDPEKGLVVIAPNVASIKAVEELVSQKSKWILDKIDYMEKKKEKRQVRKFETGEKFMFLGCEYALEVIKTDFNAARLQLVEGRFLLEHPGCETSFLKEIFAGWYKKCAQKILSESVDKHSIYFDVAPKQVKAKEQKKIWGSCTHDNKLLFNWRLVMAPKWVIDYVVVHEMCHMVHKNHSKDFWDLVEKIYPRFKDAKDWLKENSLALDIVH